MKGAKGRRSRCAGCGPIPSTRPLAVAPDGRLYCERCRQTEVWRANVGPALDSSITRGPAPLAPRHPKGAAE